MGMSSLCPFPFETELTSPLMIVVVVLSKGTLLPVPQTPATKERKKEQLREKNKK